jgi:Concanavalin A-like lectin/glucanases superfamily/NedA-like, galactose-binding domain
MSKRVYSFVFLAFVVIAVRPMSVHADIRTGLAGYWPLDDSAIDASASGNDGTIVGNVTAIPDRYGVASAALLFPGEADAYVDLGDPTELQITGAMALSAWVFLNGSNQNDGRIISKQDASGSGSWDLSIAANSDGVANAVTFQVAGSPSDSVSVSDTKPFPTDRWVHITGVYRPQRAIEIYVDGQLRVSSTADIPDNQFSDNGSSVLIGSRNDCSGCGWDGRIDEARIYNRAVTQVEIWQIMRGNVGSALSPQPADRAVDVPRDVALRWKAGLFAKTHDLYFGSVFGDVDGASRSNPRGVLIAQGLITTTYVPNSDLGFGQTYYWRIDEVNATSDNTIYKGNVWSFTVEPYAPSVKDVVAISNATSIDGAGPRNTVDGSGLNEADEHSTVASDMWLGVPTGSDPVWLEYGFDTVCKLDEMLIWNYNAPSELGLGFGLKDVTVEYSTDGAAWSALRDVELGQAPGTPDYAANTVINLGGVAAQYVRLIIHTSWGMTDQYGLSEVRFFHIPTRARYPRPADGETGVDVDLILGWSAGREATVHEVHLSNSAPLVATGAALVDSVTVNRYALRPLDLGTTYYWRIDEINQARSPSSWQGDIWTFTTRDYAMIDDFEIYTDDSGRRIYQIWKDGAVNGTGSFVGYMEAPFAEQTIVHGGGQSMPFEYNNAEAPFYSEAVRSLAIDQNWQRYEADTLRLFVRGHADNDPGSLYLAVEDTNGRVAVATHSDPTALTSATWQEWTIPYSAFDGIRLSGVQKIYLGVGDRDNPVPGGSGLIYIDDIEYGHSSAPAPPPSRRDPN